MARAGMGRLMGRRFFSAETAEINRGEIGIVAGVPEKHLQRKVVIYSPCRIASQQGRSNLGTWKLNFESTQKWENPLMGWTSTGDPYSSLGEAGLRFDSKESAIEFVKKYGWEYTVKEPQTMVLKPKAYADNFKWKGPPVASSSDE